MPKGDYPRWMYGPGEQSRIFNKDDQIPAGWEDHPSKVEGWEKPKEEKPASGRGRGRKNTDADAARGARIAELRNNGVEIADNATDEEINAATEKFNQDKVATIQQLREAGIEIADDASVDEINAAIDKLTTSNQGN